MGNKKVWLYSVFSILIIAGLSLVFMSERGMVNVLSAVFASVIFLAVVAFFIPLAYLYVKFYRPKVYGIATITKRFWAFALDYLFIHILAHVLMVIAIIFMGDFKYNYNTAMNALYGGRNEWFITELGVMGVYCLYATILDFKGGTLGKKSMDALVISENATYATLIQHLIRNLIKFIMIIPAFFLFFFPFIEIYSYEFYFLRVFILIYIYPKLNQERLFLQDFLAKTKVLDTKYGHQIEIK